MLLQLVLVLIGFVLGIIFCAWWISESPRSFANDLPRESFTHLPRSSWTEHFETTDWLQLLSKFFFVRLKNKASIREYALHQLRKEIAIVLRKINGIKSFNISQFSLGDSPPLFDSFRLVRFEESAGSSIDELVFQTGVSYNNGASFTLSVSHVLGKADFVVSVNQLSGTALLGFSSTPCEYWYFSFIEAPQMDICIKIQGPMLPFKRKIELIVSNGIKKGIRKMHVLPSIKPRFRPFFSADVSAENKMLVDEPFVQRLKVDLDSTEDHIMTPKIEIYNSAMLRLEIIRLCNLSLSFGPLFESVFVSCSIDDTSLVQNVVMIDQSEQEPCREYLNFTVDKDVFNNFHEFAECKIVEEGNLVYRVNVKSSHVERDSNSDTILEGDVILKINGVDLSSKEFGEVKSSFDLFMKQVDTPFVKLFVLRRQSASFILSRDEKVFVDGDLQINPQSANDENIANELCNSLSPPQVVGEDGLRQRRSLNVTLTTSANENMDENLKDNDKCRSKHVQYSVSALTTPTTSATTTKNIAVPQRKTISLSAENSPLLPRRFSLEETAMTTYSTSNETNVIPDNSTTSLSGHQSRSASCINHLVLLSLELSQSGLSSQYGSKSTDLANKGHLETDSVHADFDDDFEIVETPNPQVCNSDAGFLGGVDYDGTGYPSSNARSTSPASKRSNCNSKRSGLFTASSLIDCHNSLSENTFQFRIHPDKTEYLNLTVWGVCKSKNTNANTNNSNTISQNNSSNSNMNYHFPLANLSLPMGHVVKLCCLNGSRELSSTETTFTLSESKMQFSAPSNTFGLQLGETLTQLQRERIVSRCFGTTVLKFGVSDLSYTPMENLEREKRNRFPKHVNTNPPPSSYSVFSTKSLPQRSKSPFGVNHGKSYFSSVLRNAARGKAKQPPALIDHDSGTPAAHVSAVSGGYNKLKGLNSRMKPRIQESRNLVTTAVKSSIKNATGMQKLSPSSSVNSNSGSGSSDHQTVHSDSDVVVGADKLHYHPSGHELDHQSHLGESHIAHLLLQSDNSVSKEPSQQSLSQKFVQMKGNVAGRMKLSAASSSLNQSQMSSHHHGLMDKAKFLSTTRPLKQFFNRNKANNAAAIMPSNALTSKAVHGSQSNSNVPVFQQPTEPSVANKNVCIGEDFDARSRSNAMGSSEVDEKHLSDENRPSSSAEITSVGHCDVIERNNDEVDPVKNKIEVILERGDDSESEEVPDVYLDLSAGEVDDMEAFLYYDQNHLHSQHSKHVVEDDHVQFPSKEPMTPSNSSDEDVIAFNDDAENYFEVYDL